MAAGDKAHALINAFLGKYGLESLGDWAWQEHLNGASVDQIMLDIRDQDAYKQRFPAMAELARQGHAISEQSYLEYEDTVRGLLHQWGVAPGMYDTSEGIAKLLVNNVSAPEVNQRIQMAAAASYDTPSEVVDAMRRMYGANAASPGDLVSFYLDPDRAVPLLEQQYKSAQVAGAAADQRLTIDTAEAERLAKQGVTYEQARQGYGTVAATAALGTGEGETADQATRTAAAFGDAAAAQTTQRVANSRKARFQGGGNAAESDSGVSGLSGAST